MDNFEDQEQDLLFKQLTYQLMKEQLDHLKGNNKQKDRSFIYLDSNTINMFFVYLLMQMNNQKRYERKNSSENEGDSNELLEELNSVINNNKEAFEEILSRLKEEQ